MAGLSQVMALYNCVLQFDLTVKAHTDSCYMYVFKNHALSTVSYFYGVNGPQKPAVLIQSVRLVRRPDVDCRAVICKGA